MQEKKMHTLKTHTIRPNKGFLKWDEHLVTMVTTRRWTLSMKVQNTETFLGFCPDIRR